MQITQITQQNYHCFEKILPPYKKLQDVRLWGCVVDDIAVGTAVLYMINEENSIPWIWVAPEYRRRGIGGTLLDVVCQWAFKNGGQKVSVAYPLEEEWSPVFEYMLLARGFQVVLSSYPEYRITKEQLMRTLLVRKDGDGNGKNARIIPVCRLAKEQIYEILEENKYNKQYYVDHADYERADKERSMALVIDGHIEGLVLISTSGKENCLNLDVLYARNKGIRELPMLLKQATIHNFGKSGENEEICFVCTEKSGEKLCKYLLEEPEATMVKVCRGLLYSELYHERSGENV